MRNGADARSQGVSKVQVSDDSLTGSTCRPYSIDPARCRPRRHSGSLNARRFCRRVFEIGLTSSRDNSKRQIYVTQVSKKYVYLNYEGGEGTEEETQKPASIKVKGVGHVQKEVEYEDTNDSLEIISFYLELLSIT